jgi:pyridoxamine 5'-phosphate oxidase
MDFKDCVDFANETKTCYLATVEGDQPRVRALGMWYADETGFYFQT